MTTNGSKRAANQMRKSVQAKLSLDNGQGLRAIGYIRVSTEEQVMNGSGLEYQKEAIESFAKSQGYEVVAIIEDEASGASKPNTRTGFAQVLEMVQAKAFDILLVWKFDRLSRHLVYAVQTVDALQKQGIVLRSVTEPIDTSTAMGQMVFGVLAGMAGMERENITQRTRAGRVVKAEKGGYAGGLAPLGYQRTEDGLKPVEEEAATVKRIYELREQGNTLRQIAATLTQEGHKTKNGGKWYASTVAAILDNVKYSGHVEYVFGTIGKHVIKEGTHEAIVPFAIAN